MAGVNMRLASSSIRDLQKHPVERPDAEAAKIEQIKKLRPNRQPLRIPAFSGKTISNGLLSFVEALSSFIQFQIDPPEGLETVAGTWIFDKD